MGKEEKLVGVSVKQYWPRVDNCWNWVNRDTEAHYIILLYFGICLKFVIRKSNFKRGNKNPSHWLEETLYLGWGEQTHHHVSQQYGELSNIQPDSNGIS